MADEWLQFCEKHYREKKPPNSLEGNWIQIYKDDYTIEIQDPALNIIIPNGTVKLVIFNGNPYMCNDYDDGAYRLYNNLPVTLKILEITNLVHVLTNLPPSLDKVSIRNYTKEVKEKSRFPFDCDIQYTGYLIEKREIIYLDDSDEEKIYLDY
jgi:hypothetical protein